MGLLLALQKVQVSHDVSHVQKGNRYIQSLKLRNHGSYIILMPVSLFALAVHVCISVVTACREEAAGIIASQYRKKESGALAAYEEQMNDVSCEGLGCELGL